MTAFFDDLRRHISELSKVAENDDAFLHGVAIHESVVISMVHLVTGDREFPDDLREKILGHIAALRVATYPGLPPTPGRNRTRISRCSTLFEALHDDFHELARRRLDTRFGRLSDDPEGILSRRSAWDKEQ